MRVSKQPLSPDPNPLQNWNCLGFVTHMPSYRLAWLLNQRLNWSLRKEKCWHVPEKIHITHYKFAHAQAIYRLIINHIEIPTGKCPLIKEWKPFTHLLLMHTEEKEQQQVHMTLCQLKGLYYIYALNPSTTKQQSRLLE